MDPITISRLGRIRQQEILESVEKDRGAKPLRQYLADLGCLRVRIGQKLMDVAGSPPGAETVAPQRTVKHC